MSTIAEAIGAFAECVCDALTEKGAGEPCWCGPWHGDTVSMDYCDECDGGRCGLAYVRLVGTFAWQNFPEPIIQPRCALPLGYTLEVGVNRCMPTMTDTGELPDPNVIADAAFAALLDHDAMYYAISCCPPEGITGWTVAVEGYTSTGPEGNCGGGYWTVHVAFD